MQEVLSSTSTASKRNIVLVCLVLAALVLGVYMQTGNHQFLDLDDNVYVTSNPHVASGITAKNIIWAFTSVDAANWHPITWLSHMADAQFYGMNPRGHHLTNVVIHTISSLLLLLLLLRFKGSLWQSSFVAALFALHPLHVESVAWVAERKDVLSALFWLITLLFYFEYTAKLQPKLYLLSLASFVLGLMSKPMLVTLPIVMLLLDFWPLDRYRHHGQEQDMRQALSRILSLVKEKIPFFACSLLSAAVTIYAQHKGGATRGLDEIPFLLRMENASVAYLKYLIKTIWPSDLAVLYLLPSSLPLWQSIGSLLVLLLASVAAIRARHGFPYLAAGWFWYLVTLLPVIGLIQVGSQAMADRYTYIPMIGLSIMAAWGVPDLLKGLPYRKGVLALLAGSAIFVSAALTWQQLGYWQDSISLYRHTLHATTGNYLIHYNLGNALEDIGALDEAIQQYQEAIRINPNYEGAHINLGIALDSKGDLDAAIREYLVAIRINPNNAKTHNNLGVSLESKGDIEAAVREYREAIRIDPDNGKAHRNLRIALTGKGKLLQR